MKTLEKETALFENKLPELIKTDNGKFVLIKEENVIGTFAALADALKSAMKNLRINHFS